MKNLLKNNELSAREGKPTPPPPPWAFSPPFSAEENEKLMALGRQWEEADAARDATHQQIILQIMSVFNDHRRRTSSNHLGGAGDFKFQPWAEQTGI